MTAFLHKIFIRTRYSQLLKTMKNSGKIDETVILKALNIRKEIIIIPENGK